MTLLPSDVDILCGKSKAYTKHPGNIVFAGVIQQYHDAYQHAMKKTDRMKITKTIAKIMVEGHGARFLKQTTIGDGWEELSEAHIRDKVSHALRFYSNKANGRSDESSQPGSGPSERIPMEAPPRHVNSLHVSRNAHDGGRVHILNLSSTMVTSGHAYPHSDDQSSSEHGEKGLFDTLRSDDLNQIMQSVSQMEGTEYNIVKEHF